MHQGVLPVIRDAQLYFTAQLYYWLYLHCVQVKGGAAAHVIERGRSRMSLPLPTSSDMHCYAPARAIRAIHRVRVRRANNVGAISQC
ncbi:unnamed protein product, partial [Iphiclides podalirius]